MLRTMFVVLILLLSGCASDEEMRNKFGNGMPHFFTEDKTGEKYIIEHRFGDNYSIRRWKD